MRISDTDCNVCGGALTTGLDKFGTHQCPLPFECYHCGERVQKGGACGCALEGDKP